MVDDPCAPLDEGLDGVILATAPAPTVTVILFGAPGEILTDDWVVGIMPGIFVTIPPAPPPPPDSLVLDGPPAPDPPPAIAIYCILTGLGSVTVKSPELVKV
jgi:hypothetical protein